MEWLSSPEIWISFLTLAALEIVLGIDNIIFISILAGRLPEDQERLGQVIGLAAALVTRVLLLLSINWLLGLTDELFELFGRPITGTGIILFFGGLFLMGKSVWELHDNLEGEEGEMLHVQRNASFGSVIFQIALIDIVFSLDSVITAVGLADEVGVMIAAVIVAIIVMMVLAAPISRFVARHPTIKILALSFLLLIGVALVIEAFEFKIPKGYIYFAMAFSLGVELLNMRYRTRNPIVLHGPLGEVEDAEQA